MPRGFKEPIKLWMHSHIRKRFVAIEQMAIECANSVDCSSVTSRRWILQLSEKNGPFRLLEDSTEYYIEER